MKIEPIYVTFKQAKLLKEKGFDVSNYLRIDDEISLNLKSNYNPKEYQPWYLELHQWQVIEWLRVVHGMYIIPDIILFNTWCRYTTSILYTINQVDYNIGDRVTNANLGIFKTPQEAYSAAFDYTLNNLI